MPPDSISFTRHRSVRRQGRAWWDVAPGYQRLAYVVGAALMVVGVMHAGFGVVTGETISGPLSWRKPAAFGVSFGLTTVTLGWMANYLPRHRIVGWTLAAALSASTTFEVAWVTVQHARGVPAHFNPVPFEFRLFVGAAAAVGVTVVVIAAMTLAAFTVLAAPPPMAVAIRTGLASLIVAQAMGVWLVLHGMALVDDGADPLSQSMSTYGAAGAMKVAHAVPMHAIQVLSAAAWLLSLSGLSQRRQFRIVNGAAVGYSALIVAVVVRTALGLPPI